MAIVVVSFDGVKDSQFKQMAKESDTYPNIAKFMNESVYKGGVRSVFVSNTYPIHTTVSTGKLAREHGVISNFTVTGGKRRWAQLARDIRVKTIWDAAAEHNLTTAAIFWPVTCGAINIKWNMPEAHTHGRENQIAESLRHGSALFQIKALARHGSKLNFRDLTSLDSFSTAVTCDLLRKQQPDLTLLHLLAYDIISHRYSTRSPEINAALKSLDISLGKIMAAAGDTPVLVFSDHGHLDVFESVDLRHVFGDILYEQCGGCAFFTQTPADIENQLWFGRFLTEQEMQDSGYSTVAACGIAAKPGYCFSEKQYKSNHGYPVDYDDYSVFYALKSEAALQGLSENYGDVRDVTGIITRELGISL